jgi:hypothetical protein
MAKQFIVVRQQIIGLPEAWSTQYSWDGQRHDTRQAAIDAGLRGLGHDDFNVGTVEDGRLVAFGWDQYDFAPAAGYDLDEIGRQIGLGVRA